MKEEYNKKNCLKYNKCSDSICNSVCKYYDLFVSMEKERIRVDNRNKELKGLK